jgi:uncharacterized membrane protein YfcA
LSDDPSYESFVVLFFKKEQDFLLKTKEETFVPLSSDARVIYLVLLLAAFVAGVQNALAGGGSFITFPSLLLLGMDARAANITSTIALFPGQVTTGLANRRMVTGAEGLSFWVLFALSLAGGAVGAVLLLLTPAHFFDLLVPFLVLFATIVFAWGSFLRKPDQSAQRLGPVAAGSIQFCIAIYGGYFGGGIGLLMIAALTLAGLQVRQAGATKNALAAVMNAAAVAIFLYASRVHWIAAGVVAAGAIAGGAVGAWALTRVNERLLRIAVVCIGALLTVSMFVRAYG